MIFQSRILEAINHGNAELVTELLTNEKCREKIDLNDTDPEDGNNLLHCAVKHGHEEIAHLLLQVHDLDCNAYNNANLTPLLLCALSGNPRLLKILLESSKIDVNATDPDTGQNLLHILVKKVDSVQVPNWKDYLDCLHLGLGQRGLDLNINAMDDNGQTPQDLAIEREDENLVKLFNSLKDCSQDEEGHRLRRRQVLVNHIRQNDDVAIHRIQKLIQKLSAEEINKSAPGVNNLIQEACEHGADTYLKLLLQVPGVCPNSFANGTKPPLFLAAERVDAKVLKLLLGVANTEITTDQDASILHVLLRKPIRKRLGDYLEVFELIMDSCEQLLPIDCQDVLGNTALHYATQMWPHSVVKRILEHGAHIATPNLYNQVPLDKIHPQTLEDFLNESCILPDEEREDISSLSYMIRVKFDFLIRNSEDSKEDGIIPETEGLWHMSQSKKHSYLLNHPVITTFLWLKWKKLGYIYNINLAFFLAFFLTMIFYIFTNFQSLNDCQTGSAAPIALHYTAIVFLSILCSREVFQLVLNPTRYIGSPSNWVDILLIGLTSHITIFSSPDCSVQQHQRRHSAAFIIILSCYECVTMLGRHPRWATANTYVVMLYKVLQTFIQFLAWYSVFIVAFAMGFYILLHDEDHQKQQQQDKYIFFDSLDLSLIKTFTMFVGELEFGDLPIKSRIGYLFLLVFVFFIVVVLMNLLNGLAVNDIAAIREEAQVHTYKTQVEILSYIEAVLLGDPTDFLERSSNIQLQYYLPSMNLKGLMKLLPSWTKSLMVSEKKIKLLPSSKGKYFQFKVNEKTSRIQCFTFDQRLTNNGDELEIPDLPVFIKDNAKCVVERVQKEAQEDQAQEEMKAQIRQLHSKLDQILQKL